MESMKILIISHNCLGKTSNMGKTLLSYFQGITDAEIAQFYIHSEVPVEDTVCRSYYRFTDRDALRSWVSLREYGTVFGREDIQRHRTTARTDTGLLRTAYQFGRRRTPSVYALRNLLWKCSRWNTEKLRRWVTDFDPDVVFFASGDYGFLYDIAVQIAQQVQKPLAVCCVDDFYLHNSNEKRLFGRLVHRAFLKTVRNTMAHAAGIFVICESMGKAYEALFHKKCYILHTAAAERAAPEACTGGGIVYLGNVSLQRSTQLAAMGRALQAIHIPGVPQYMDVYSAEESPEFCRELTRENGIRFHGAVPAEQVPEILQSSMAVIHTESFDPKLRGRLRFSISTKIAESLMNGPCLLAYGPEGIASIDYLQAHGAAYVITEPSRLEEGLRTILTNAQLRRDIVARARELAHRNHSEQKNAASLAIWLKEICEEQRSSRVL